MNLHNETSTSSQDSFLPHKKRKVSSPSDATDDVEVVADDAVHTEPSVVRTKNSRARLKHKGIVQQWNGRWGAQIYQGDKRTWIGTFGSDVEAARAYDIVALKINKTDVNSHRNISGPVSMVQEKEFQEGYTTEAVLNMIRDGSYQHKLREFLDNQSQIVKKTAKQSGSRTYLFQKELTPSDVGKLNRLVIPKRYALSHLPHINIDQSEREEGEIVDVEEVEVVVYDKAMSEWKFRYCFWKGSQSYVFTRGWTSFVKDKELKEKDVIVFYSCERDTETLQSESKNFLMIDVKYFSENDSVVPEEVKETVHESSDSIELKTESVVSSKLEEDEETKSEEKKGGFMLFGVRIQ